MKAKDILDVVKFCCADEDDRRPALVNPFREDNYIVGTDGKIAVRYFIPDGAIGFPEEEDGHPKTREIFPNHEDYRCFLKLSEEDKENLSKMLVKYREYKQKEKPVNPNGFDVVHCPCCGTRLYIDDDQELLDADEYDSYQSSMNGFLVKTCKGDYVIKGWNLYRVLKCSGCLDIITESKADMYIKVISNTYAQLIVMSDSYEMISTMNSTIYGKDYEIISEICLKGESNA